MGAFALELVGLGTEKAIHEQGQVEGGGTVGTPVEQLVELSLEVGGRAEPVPRLLGERA